MFDFDQKMGFVDRRSTWLNYISLKGHRSSFDSHMEEHDARCLGDTRVELQHYIAEWAKDRNGKPVWLNGMAGTGKSTIT